MMGWQWHQLDHIQIICTSLQTDDHASTSPLTFLQAERPSCRTTNSVKALKAFLILELRIVKFLTQVGYITCYQNDDITPPNERDYDHVTVFKFCCLP